jgi:hypothetical protein
MRGNSLRRTGQRKNRLGKELQRKADPQPVRWLYWLYV